ncbi:MAG: DUF255 domain-containing protein [Planctomycetota bacterium]
MAMPQRLASFLAALPLAAVLCAQEPATAPKPKPAAAAPVYDEAADARAQIAAAVAIAKRDNQRVLVQWGANWCGWCKWLAGTMQSDEKLARELRYEYQVVHVDVGRFDKHMDVAKELGASWKGIPYLTVLDADGKPLTHADTEPFETKVDGKNGHDAGKLLAFLKQHEAKPRVAADVLAAALAQAKKEQKVAFLHFGAPWCGWCHKLEAWMARPEVAARLGKDFVDVKVDEDRMAGGMELKKAQMAAAGPGDGGIPWFVFLDGDGKQLAHSTGPQGNTGFPYQPAEVAHFVTMLQAVKKNLTDDDIAYLRQSLDDNRAAEEAARAKAKAEAAQQRAQAEKAKAESGGE